MNHISVCTKCVGVAQRTAGSIAIAGAATKHVIVLRIVQVPLCREKGAGPPPSLPSTLLQLQLQMVAASR